MKNSLIFIVVSLILFISCDSHDKKETIYFGGQIKNPKDDIVVIYKNDKQIASTKLNQNNNFLFKLDSISNGLYRFKHGQEFQYIYLEKKDSLLIRLNTWDFDGSLVFSGKGSHRNNFLIQLFLENEQEERELYKFFNLDEEYFSNKVDSVIKLKKLLYNQYKNNSQEQSDDFNDLINDIIYLPTYANKEEYPIQYKKHHKLKKLPQLSNKFYNHRTLVINNNNPFKDYYAYKNYLWNNIYNLAYYKLEQDTLLDLSSVLLKQISQSINDIDIKNNMLQQAFVNSLFDSSCDKKYKEHNTTFFLNHCNDKLKKDKVKEILSIINTLKKNTKLPEFYLKNTSDKLINSKILLGKNTVIYFWPKEANRIDNMAKRISYLIKKYPSIQFIGIDGQLENYDWKNYIELNNLELTKQFKLTDNNNKLFYTNDFPRAIIIDKNGIIKSNFTFISQYNFEPLLHKLEK